MTHARPSVYISELQGSSFSLRATVSLNLSALCFTMAAPIRLQPTANTLFRPGSSFMSLIDKSSLRENAETLSPHIGSVVTGALKDNDAVTIYYRRGKLALADPRDVIILGELSEDDALRVMATLNLPDESMIDHLERRESQAKADAKGT